MALFSFHFGEPLARRAPHGPEHFAFLLGNLQLGELLGKGNGDGKGVMSNSTGEWTTYSFPFG